MCKNSGRYFGLKSIFPEASHHQQENQTRSKAKHKLLPSLAYAQKLALFNAFLDSDEIFL